MTTLYPKLLFSVFIDLQAQNSIINSEMKSLPAYLTNQISVPTLLAPLSSNSAGISRNVSDTVAAGNNRLSSEAAGGSRFTVTVREEEGVLKENESVDGALQSKIESTRTRNLTSDKGVRTLCNDVTTSGMRGVSSTLEGVEGLKFSPSPSTSEITKSSSAASTRRETFAKFKLKRGNLAECKTGANVCIEMPSGGFKVLINSSESTPVSSNRVLLHVANSACSLAGSEKRKVWQGKAREISMSFNSSSGRELLKKTISGSLETLLEAVETELPSEKKQKEIDPLPRSPSLCALDSFDCIGVLGDLDTSSSDFEDPLAGSRHGSSLVVNSGIGDGGVDDGDSEEWMTPRDNRRLAHPLGVSNALRRSSDNLLARRERGKVPGGASELDVGGNGMEDGGGKSAMVSRLDSSESSSSVESPRKIYEI